MTVSNCLSSQTSDADGTGVQITAGGRVAVEITGTFDIGTRVILLGADTDAGYVPLDKGIGLDGEQVVPIDVSPNLYINARLVDAGPNTSVTVKFIY